MSSYIPAIGSLAAQRGLESSWFKLTLAINQWLNPQNTTFFSSLITSAATSNMAGGSSGFAIATYSCISPPTATVDVPQTGVLGATVGFSTNAFELDVEDPAFSPPQRSALDLTMQEFGNFDLIHRNHVLDFAGITVSRWRSRVTGLTVIHLDYEAPIVKGYFVLPTETFDDSGCPHTLEHLVFMGSEKYPYKGILDRFANRGFAFGTDAWTARDRTCYTVATAGSQGFLQILPIYVDHILNPTLTKEAYLTEVHHIDSQGHDAGVVYCEMQERQNNDLLERARQRLVYPEDSGYRWETCGLTEDIRVLSVDQIRKYHEKYYVPHNLALVVGGKFLGGTEELLSVVDKEIEPSIVAHGQNKGAQPSGWRRPFVETSSAIREPFGTSQFTDVHFAEKDTSMGNLLLTFMGPAPDQKLELQALHILLDGYLTSSSIAPLNKEYIEIETPLYSFFGFYIEIRPTLVDLVVQIHSIPTEHLQDFDSKLKDSLRKIIRDGINMDRMMKVINRDERQLRCFLEAQRGDGYSRIVITDFVLGPSDGSDLPAAFDHMSLYPILRKWTSEEWTSLLQKYFVDPPCVVVRGIPSAALAEKLKGDEEKRHVERAEALGPEGLRKAKEELEAALAKHDEPIPEEIITSFPLPDVRSIAWIPVQSVQERSIGPSVASKKNEPLKKHIESDGSALPFFIEFDHVQSDFFTIYVNFSLADVPLELKPLVTIYMIAFFELPVQCSDGKKLSYEEVVAKLDDETVSFGAGIGAFGNFSETALVSIQAETNMYENTVRWIHDLIYGAEFDITRLKVTCAKIMQDMPARKRSGPTVLDSLLCEMIYDENSTTRTNSILFQADNMTKVIHRLNENPEDVQKDFQLMRKYVTNPSALRFAVAGNILSIKNPRRAWSEYFGKRLTPTPLKPIILSDEKLTKLGREPKAKAVVVGLPTIESSFVSHVAKSLKGFQHPEFPALCLALETLNACEGFLFRAIRGSGLAYGASILCDLESGLLFFGLNCSSDSIKAFREGEKAVRGLANGTIPLEDTVVDAGKSSLVYGIAQSVSNPGAAAARSFNNQALKGVSQDFHLELLEKCRAVTTEEVLAVIRKYVLPVFDPKQSIAVTVTAIGKVGEVVDGLEEIGYEVETREINVEPEEVKRMDEVETSSEGVEISGK